MRQPSEVLRADPNALARKLVNALARIGAATNHEKARTVSVGSAQISGVSYVNIGDAGLEFLEDWAASGAKVHVPSYMNPGAIDLERWKELGISDETARKQRRIIDALQQMGVAPSLTCTPYECYAPPKFGEHLAWSESSAVCVANSLFGARTNREGGPSALASGICGFTPLTGYHLDEHRTATHAIRVKCPIHTVADFGALGLIVGSEVGQGVPYSSFPQDAVRLPREELREGHKALAAAMAATGAVALFHIEGVTPEAERASKSLNALPEIEISSLDAGYNLVNTAGGWLDVVVLGCPHESYDELERVAALVKDKQLKTRLWICTSRYVFKKATQSGLKDMIERCGAKVLADMCLVVAPLSELGVGKVATNSAKTAYYLRSRENVSVSFGSLGKCIDAAMTGEWKSDGKVTPVTAHTKDMSAPKRTRGSLRGVGIVEGHVRGEVLCSREPIGFFGHVNPVTGVVTEPGHELQGKSIAGKVLVFPRAKGSTVGSYVLYALKRVGCAPLAIVNEEMEPIVAAGAVIAGIPAVDGIDTSLVKSGQVVEVDGGEIRIV